MAENNRKRSFTLSNSWLIFVFFLSFYILTLGRTQEYGYADGSVMYNVTKSIVEDGTLKSRVYGYYRGNALITHSKYGLGYSVACVPFYIISRQLGKWIQPDSIESFTRRSPMFTNTLISALSCLVFYHLILLVFKRSNPAILLTLLYGMTTLTWSYARSDFSEPLNTFFLISSVYYLVKNRFYENNIRNLIYAGLFLGLAIFTRFASIILIPAWLWFLFLNNQEKNKKQISKSLLNFGLPLLFFIGLCLWYNHYRYGSIWVTGYETDLGNSRLGNIFFTGFYGLLLSFGKGLFWYNPVLILSLLGFGFLWQKDRLFFYFVISIILVHLILYSSWPAWEGGWCWGPRNLIPTIPFLMLVMGYWYQYSPKSKINFSLSLTILGFLGFFIQFIGIALPYGYYIQTKLDQGIPFNEIWLIPRNSPLWGHFSYILNLPLTLWDFLIIRLFQTSYSGWVILILGIILILWVYTGLKLIRRLNFTD